MTSKTTKLAGGKSAPEILDMYFLDARMHLLETAAFLDRLGRAREAAKAIKDPRVKKLLAAANMLTDGKPERAERFQRLFSVK